MESLLFVQTLRAFGALVTAFVITWYLVPHLIAVAYSLQILDKPDGRLKVQSQATPYLGGVAVYIGFITALALLVPFQNNILLLIIGSTLLLLIGFIDDLVVLNPRQKFVGQIIATLCFLRGGFYLKETFFLSGQSWLSSFFWLWVSFWWILSVINAFNLIDVMDGLATTIALCISITLFMVAWWFSLPVVMCIIGAFIGALLGFLYYNWPRARMYLGDAGSLFIGGFTAIIPFMIPWGMYNHHGFITPLIMYLILPLEVCALIVIRLYKGIPFYNGSPDHFATYLRKKGWTVQRILYFVIIFSLVLAILGFLCMANYISTLVTLIIACILIFLWIWVVFSKKTFKI